MRWRAMFICLALAGAACGSGPTAPGGGTCTAVVASTSTTLRAGDLFRYRFTVPAVPGTDVLVTFLAEFADVRSQSPVTVRLYDGARLLATAENATDSVVVFKSPQSRFGTPGNPYGLSGPATVADFTTIATGAIDGRVEYSILSGPVSVDHLEKATVVLLHPDDPGNFRQASISGRELCRSR